METSFIPKQQTYKKPSTKKRNYGGLLMGIGGFIFIVTVLVAGTIFLYNRYLASEIDTMAQSLEREKGSLEKEIIKKLSLIDKRIEASKEVLNNHVTLVPLFDLLEQNTLQKVMFTELSFYPGDDGWWNLSMKGTTNSYATVALQSDVFGKNKNMKELIFSNLGIGNDGGVIFDVSAMIDPRLLSYRNSLE